MGGCGGQRGLLKGIEAKEVKDKGRQGFKFSAQLSAAQPSPPFHFKVLILKGVEMRRLLWLWAIMHHLFNERI